MVLSFPIKRIEWGIYSGVMKAFISQGKVSGKRDFFLTWVAAERFIDGVYGSGRAKNNLYARPRKVYAYNELTPEEV
jgi:hypothetical protein